MAQFIFTCPFCSQQFAANDEMIGQNAICSNCGVVVVIQRQLQPIQNTSATNSMLVLGILGLFLWLIPLFGLPVPIIGFAMSIQKNYRLGIILNAIGMGLAILWTFTCIAADL